VPGDVQRSQLGSTPLPGDKPTGTPCRYEPDFEFLAAEIEKLESVTGGEVDWREAGLKATALLEEKSKDLLVAVYFCRVLFEQESFPGFLDGLTIVRDLLKTFWDDLYPEVTRLRARSSTLQWLADKMTPLVEAGEGPPDVLESCRALVEEIDGIAGEKFEPGQGPALGPLSRGLAAKTQEATPTEEEAEGAPAGEAPGSATAAAPSAPGGPIANRQEAFRRLKEVKAFFEKVEPHSPVIYLVDRAIRWKDMSLQDVIKEILVTNRDARNIVWQQLGLERETS